MPPKVRNFIWRACANILPTRESLHQRRVNVDAWCELCCQQPESAGHLLWECPFARNVWALCLGKIQKCPNEAIDFFLLFKTLVQRLSMEELEIWAVVLGEFGMHAIEYILREFNPTPKPSWQGLLGSCRNTKTSTTHKGTVEGANQMFSRRRSILRLVVIFEIRG